MQFLSSLLSKKLGFAGGVEALIYTLPMTADQKGMAMAIAAVGFLIAQAYVDAHAPKAEPVPAPDPKP